MYRIELLFKINQIIEEIIILIKSEELRNSQKLRDEYSINIYTKNCPFYNTDYYSIIFFTRTLTVKKNNKILYKSLKLRLNFWKELEKNILKLPEKYITFNSFGEIVRLVDQKIYNNFWFKEIEK